MTVTVVCGREWPGPCRMQGSAQAFRFHVCQVRHEKGTPHAGAHVCGTCRAEL